MLRHFRLSKVSMGITMVLVLLSGILVGSFLPMIQANAESTSPVIVGKNLQLTFSATNSQQQTDWQIQFQANPQLTATRFKLEADNQAVTKIQQANQEIPADKDGYFELTKDQLQNTNFTAAKNQDVKVTLATKNETETAFFPEGNGTFTISASTAGAVDESLEETVEPPTKESTVETSSSTVESSSQTVEDADTSNEASNSTETNQLGKTLQAPSLKSASLGIGATSIPKGAIKLSGLFSTVSKNRGGTVGQIITPHDTPTENNGMPYDEIQLSGKQVAIGVWSKEDYRLDFSKSFKGRTYVNFGENDGKTADGFAFVMQNEVPVKDPNGNISAGKDQSLTTANAKTDGQNLGVYGGTESYIAWTVKHYPDQFAIKNSIAVEFDLYPNVSGDAVYDKYQSADKAHMAWSLPGNRKLGYKPVNSDWFTGILNNNSSATIVHNNPIALAQTDVGEIRNGSWYEFHYNFDKDASDDKKFSYYLTNPTTGVPTSVTYIPWTTISSELNLAGNGNKAYWGFTSANGESTGSVKFVFTQMPVDLGATVTNDVVASNTSIIDESDATEYDSKLPAAKYGQEVTLKSTFERQIKDSSTKVTTDFPVTVSKWESWLDPTVYDLSKGIKNLKLNGATYSDVKVDTKSTGNIIITFTSPPSVASGGTAVFEFTATLKDKGNTVKTHFESQITASGNTDGDLRTFSGEAVPYWVKEIPKVTVIFQDTMGHEIKRQSGVNIPDGTSVNISNEINTLFTALGLDKYTALGANDTNNVKNSYGGYKLKNPSLYESFDSTKRDTDYNSGYIYDYNSSGQLEMRVTLLSPVSYTITMDASNSGNSIADIIGWGDRIGFQTGNVAGKGGVQYANFANTENRITGEKAILTVSQYGNNITVYGMEGDQFDIRKWEFKYPIMNVTTETPNGTHVIGKIREDSALTLRTWNYGTNTAKVTEVDQQLGISGELSPKFMWYKDNSGISHSLIVSPQTTDLNNDGKVDVIDSYRWLGVAPGWTLNLDGPKKLQFKLHLPDGSQKDSENSVGAYPVHKMPTAGTVPNPLPEYPAYQQLYGIVGSETSIDALMTEYKDQLHQDYPASTFKLRQDSIETVKANQSFSDKAWDLLHLYFISNTLSLKGQFVDSSGNKIEGEFPVQTNADGTVEFAHKEDSTTVIVPFDTKTDENVNLQKLLKNSGKNIPAGYILAPDASFEYQLAENPDAIRIKLIKVDVPNTGIKNSSQNMTIILVVMSSVVSVGFYLYKRRQNI
ncbi:hypothetical protein P7G51_02995 [Enterococcus asini]|uniref:lectin-like domain-containing protein n=1 Tax=Enterococcus asini TaxID=57732 RepID=UPI00288D4A37|nr:hypothetical protein [Enterococcus asini]MDT2756348.1 hypothetical protein [Enterococcus asini]